MREIKYPAPFVTNEQLAIAKVALRRGASLSQAAQRAECMRSDLDIRLWQTLGEASLPVAMFR